MTNEEAINLAVHHFLLDQESPGTDVTNALDHICQTQPIEELGRAVFSAMLKAHLARLHGDRATAVAQLPRRTLQ